MQLSLSKGTDSGSSNVLNICASTSEISEIIKEFDSEFDDTKLLMSDMYINQIPLEGIANWGQLLAEQDTEQLIKDIIYVSVVGYSNEPDGKSPFYYSYEALGNEMRAAKGNDTISLMSASPRVNAASGVPNGISKCRSMLGLPEQPDASSTISFVAVQDNVDDGKVHIDLSVIADKQEEIEDCRMKFLSSFVPMGGE